MKYHKNYNNYMNFLSDTFPNVQKIEFVYKNFDMVIAIIDNDNFVCADELYYELNLSLHRIRVKLRELENEGILKSVREKKINNSYKKKYYSCLLSSEVIEKLKSYLYCDKCGKRLSKFGGIVHTNIECKTKIFCTKECRDEWCYE